MYKFITSIFFLFCLQAGSIFAAVPADFSGFSEAGSTDGKYGEFRFKVNWNPDDGFAFILADKGRKRQCRIDLHEEEVAFLGEKIRKGPRTLVNHADRLPRDVKDGIFCHIKLDRHFWGVFLDDKEIFRFHPPFTADSLWLEQAQACVSGKIRFQKTAPLNFQDDFLIPEKDLNQLDSWEMLKGEWAVHTAMEDAVEQKTTERLKDAPLQMERSSNFYSLKGSGKDGLIVAGYPFNDNYMVQAAMQVKKGECGLAFYVQDEENYHSFTVMFCGKNEAYALLKRHRSGGKPEILKAVSLSLLEGNWIMLKVEIMDEHISAFIDRIKVMELDESLPPGGQFGLYVDSPQSVLFDDVSAESLPFLKLDDPEGVKLNTHFARGEVFRRPGIFGWLSAGGIGKHLFPGAATEDRWLIIGSPEDKVAVFEISFKPESADAAAGLILGWRNGKEPHCRFIFEQRASERRLRLEKLKKDGAPPILLETADISDCGSGKEFVLKAELSPDGLVKLYCGGRLVMLHKEASVLVGAAGIFVGSGSRISLNKIVCHFKPEDVFRDKLEKNQIFSNDPFMRHWASPAGEWVRDDSLQGSWHKGSFFKPFSLTVPAVAGSEVHLGATDDNASGDLAVGMDGFCLEVSDSRSGKSLLKRPLSSMFRDNPTPDILTFYEILDDKLWGRLGGKKLVLNPPAQAQYWNPEVYRLSSDGDWLWGESGGGLMFKLKLPRPLSGKRIFIKGFSDKQVWLMHATRDNVLDFLFTESLHEWTVNGGLWQVINRFQCDPRWSHMNGQSNDDLASLWSKYLIEGDFCIEMYAGTRHGDWYYRVGDLNLTVMNRNLLPSSGYSFVCTGWDPDFSQTKSKLIRDGKTVSVSDKYLSPRLRDGNVRKHTDPLIAAGRDVHGAWYYIKARRTGRLVEYSFDNEKIFSYEDKEPISCGGFGIWTFLNSMMVARLKVAAEKIRPKEFAFQEVDPEKVPDIPPAEAAKPPETPVLLLNGLPADLMTPETWRLADAAGAPELAFSDRSFTVRNILGGGRFAVQPVDLVYPENGIAGWTCEIKRTADARFNFHFELGKVNQKGDYTILQRYFHRISGSDYSKGLFQMAGDVGKLSPAALQSFGSGGNWTRIWLPVPYIMHKFPDTKELVWKAVGFGNLHPSELLEGFGGNGPGEAYAVRNFAPVFAQVPTVELKGSAQPNASYELAFGTVNLSTDSLEKLNLALKGAEACPGLTAGTISAAGKGGRSELFLAMPDEKNSWSCRWDDGKPHSIIVSSSLGYRHVNGGRLSVKIQDVELPLEELSPNTFRVSMLDRLDEDFRKLIQGDTIKVEIIETDLKPPPPGDAAKLELHDSDRDRTFTLSWKDCPAPAAPILANLEGVTPFFQSFESPNLRNKVSVEPERMKFEWDKERTGFCLAVSNIIAFQRLRAEFSAGMSVAQYPLLQFLYKTDPMGQISCNLQHNAIVQLCEPHMDNARKVRFSQEIEKDMKWHAWLGFATDAFDKNTFSPSVFKPPKVTFGSFQKEDQTGRNSELSLDDVVFGPAVRIPEQLALTPHYFTRVGEPKVFIALVSGDRPYFALAGEETKKIRWKEIPNRQKYIPALDGLAEGVHQILLKAADGSGRESDVTSIPFFLDKTPETANFAFKPSDDIFYNGSALQVEWLNPGAGSPLNYESVEAAFNGQKVAVDRQYSRLEHRQDADVAEINWSFSLSPQIDKMKDGESADLILSGLEDGAGNKTPDIKIPIKINYSEDKLPPTFLAPSLTKNIYSRIDPLYTAPDRIPFGLHNISAAIATDENSKFFRFAGGNGDGYCNFPLNAAAQIDSSLYLAMRLRFPKADVPANAHLLLDIRYSEGRIAYVNLMDGKISDSSGSIDKTLDLKNAGWQNSVVDFKDVFIKRFGENEYKPKIRVETIYMHTRSLNPANLFDMSCATVFDDFKPDDKITINSHDRSGIDSLDWNLIDADGKSVKTGKCPSREFSFAQLDAPSPLLWLEFTLSDKAGNKTLPMIFPITIYKKMDIK